jgi:hypothetical protein
VTDPGVANGVAAYRGLLELTEDELLDRIGATPADVRRNLRYEKLEGLDVVDRPDASPARIFLRDGRVELVYLPEGPALAGLTAGGLQQELGPPEAWLASRVGKAFSQCVNATQGVAYATDGDELAFVELFRPRSLAEYERDIYQDPGPFVR